MNMNMNMDMNFTSVSAAASVAAALPNHRRHNHQPGEEEGQGQGQGQGQGRGVAPEDPYRTTPSQPLTNPLCDESAGGGNASADVNNDNNVVRLRTWPNIGNRNHIALNVNATANVTSSGEEDAQNVENPSHRPKYKSIQQVHRDMVEVPDTRQR
ncbi:RAMA domain-containing protein [Pycnococcus provasolii]